MSAATVERDRTNGIAGPYWIDVDHEGGFHICGAYGKHIRFYPAEQKALADADVRSLQRHHIAAERVLRDTAPDLLSDAKALLALLHLVAPEYAESTVASNMAATIAKAEGKN